MLLNAVASVKLDLDETEFFSKYISSASRLDCLLSIFIRNIKDFRSRGIYSLKVSIVTATWNSAKTIRDSIESVVSQDYGDIEHIIVDGESSDNTLDIVGLSGIKNTKVISERDNGIYDALNKGIDLATGDIIAFLHSDDTFAKSTTISSIVTHFRREQCDAVYGDLDYVAKDDCSKVIRRWESRKYERFLLKRGWMPPHPAFFMKKSAYTKLGNFDTTYQISSDYDALLRYLLSEQITTFYLPEVVSKMRVGGVSNRSLATVLLKMSEDYRIMKRHGLPPLYCLLAKNISKIKQFFN